MKPNYTFSYLDEGIDSFCIFPMTYSVERNSVALALVVDGCCARLNLFFLFTAALFAAGSNSELSRQMRGREAGAWKRG